MEKNTDYRIFFLSTPEAILIDPEKQRRERSFNDAQVIVNEALQIMTYYEAYCPEEMYPCDDEESAIRRKYANVNKSRAMGLARGIIQVAGAEIPTDIIESEIDNDLGALFKQ